MLRDANGDVASKVVQHQVATDLAANVGLGRRFALGVVLPIALYQSGDDSDLSKRALGGASVPGQAIGDVALVGKAHLSPAGELGGFGLAEEFLGG
ncbi:MAG: hypothetical protein U0165_18800 [Polyangiaceae bacterium]